MKIKKLELVNFKRFTHLVIDMSRLPEAPKLVLLVGVNGSGKSSVFDAFEAISRGNKINNPEISLEDYYRKDKNNLFEIKTVLSDGKVYTLGFDFLFKKSGYSGTFLYNKDEMLWQKINQNSFYGRSSLRQVPKLTKAFLGGNTVDIEKDSDRPRQFIDRDERFENDLENITRHILQDVFKSKRNTDEIINEYLNPINQAFVNIFGENEATSLRFKSLAPPGDGKVAEILFQKGNTEIHYDLLSSGEKEIFNILLNFLSRRQYFQDTVYFLDELDLHLNTKLQKGLLKEITENWIPDNCQLWTASHSVGFIEYANETDNAALIDFDNLDFDLPQTIYPSQKNNFDIFEIAVSKELLSQILSDKRIVFCENTDASLYNSLSLKDTVFFVANDKTDVFHKSQNMNNEGLIDKDYLSDDEIILLNRIYPKLKILKYYSIENYLYHPENLEEYYESIKKLFDKQNYIQQITEVKNKEKEGLLMGINGARSGYPFFKENKNKSLLDTFKSSGDAILALIRSDDFETFYKIFPAKDKGKTILERQNLSRQDLAKTRWFKEQIQQIMDTKKP
jgi:AAA15 family ATPase/GTPase